MSVFAGRAVFPTTFADPHGNGRAGLTIAVYRRLTYTDGVTVLGSKRLTSATAAFTSADEGKSISAENFPSGATIETYVSATEVDLSVEATAGGSGASFIIAGRQRSADLATVYTDRLKSETTSNPYVADVDGNTFPYVDPGDYDAVTVHGVVPFSAAPDHEDVETVVAGLPAHLADAVDAHDASAISVVPAGSLAATTVQAALAELDAEKQPIDSDLTAIAALSTTAFGRGLLALADGAALAGSIPSGTFAGVPTPGTAGTALTTGGVAQTVAKVVTFTSAPKGAAGWQLGQDSNNRDIVLTHSVEDANQFGNRAQFKAMGDANSVQIELVPGPNCVNDIRCQFLFFHTSGANYQRFGVTAGQGANPSYKFVSNKLGTGQYLPIVFAFDSVDDPASAVTAMDMRPDGTVNAYRALAARSLVVGADTPGQPPAATIAARLRNGVSASAEVLRLQGGGGAPTGFGTRLATFLTTGAVKFAEVFIPGQGAILRFEGTHDAGDVPIQVFAKTDGSQTGALTQWRTSGGTQMGVDHLGRLRWYAGGLAQTTVGAAGAAAALPATPSKYLHVVDAGGTLFVIPAYAAS